MPAESTINRSDLTEPNAAKTYTVKRADLPLSCPTPDMSLWNSHPRVYLPSKIRVRLFAPTAGQFMLEDD